MSQCFIQLREEFDQGWEIQMDEENSIHDVAALLKEFFRDLPDPLLTRDLYTAFINTTCKQHIVKHTHKFKINHHLVTLPAVFAFKLVIGRALFCFLQCWTLRTRSVPFSCSSFYFLHVTATRCTACSVCCQRWLHMQKTAWTVRDRR